MAASKRTRPIDPDSAWDQLRAEMRRLREEKGWSQPMLGRKLNRVRSRISHYENGLSRPPVDIVRQYDKVFQTGGRLLKMRTRAEEQARSAAEAEVPTPDPTLTRAIARLLAERDRVRAEIKRFPPDVVDRLSVRPQLHLPGPRNRMRLQNRLEEIQDELREWGWNDDVD
jgi:transcriptional regulator with XRE-family HTH domain